MATAFILHCDSNGKVLRAEDPNGVDIPVTPPPLPGHPQGAFNITPPVIVVDDGAANPACYIPAPGGGFYKIC